MARRPASDLATSGEVFHLIRTGEAVTRAEIGRITGLSRPAVALRVQELLAHGLVVERTDGPSTGGRPPVRLEFNASGGVVLTAALGVSRTQIAVCDLAGDEVARSDGYLDVEESPSVIVPMILDEWDALLGQAGVPASAVRGAAIGLPATVEFAAGRVQSTRVMAKWNGVAIPPLVAERFRVPLFVDNDVNMIALGEHRLVYQGDADDLLFVKVSTRIGAGVVAGGQVQRGALGAAGEIAHIPVREGLGAECRCGNVDCLEAVASGAALAARLRELGRTAIRARDVVALLREGDPEAEALVRDAGRRLGDVVSMAVNLLNPDVVVLGGDLADAFDPLVAGVREVVYQRATALASRRLRINPSSLGERSAVAGCAVLVLDHILAPDAVTHALHAAPPAAAVPARSAVRA
ncbi:ROK family transcriptional regulator [Bailinhaonella thermotolerans]|uniref:ROK family transcriptional regulator n=1 Tax=Bailinhaonella thermotolerans TaxID=1070861 RepID=A0A3A4APM8_9ACTN|nr:ROK family transcriptional regulator [Bailinhaonella thermotolerans]RJL31626.1 ROK family transcriptional regulator [Bailinhaonella thermotolerans]